MRHLLLLSLAVVAVAARSNLQTIQVEDKEYWQALSSAELSNTLKREIKNKPAKNVIIFVGDGMGMTTITAGRIYGGQQLKQDGASHILSFEKFPCTGLSKTYNFNKQVPDSASTATAMFTGVKTQQHVLGLDSTAPFGTCVPEANKQAHVTSFMTWAQKSGRDTGIVTTTRITHATPAATYSHINNRDWECDAEIPPSSMGCVKDIARQLVEDAPGKYFKVILGGGRNPMGDKPDPRDKSCMRQDGRNLAAEWKNSKPNGSYVTTAEELSRVDTKKTDYLLGLFSTGHLNYSADRDPVRPSLKLMTTTAIKMLEKNPRGYALMVEGGRIDHGHHENMPGLALSELVDMDEAVEAAVQMTNQDETLIIVTADHSHAMTMNGYPSRNTDILGLAQNTSDLFFQTLTYANGPGFTYHYEPSKNNNCSNCTEEMKQKMNPWRDIRHEENMTSNMYYRHFAPLYLVDETHGGEDVPIYAIGPMSHLLIGVHEQNYIAAVMSYATCMGPQADKCPKGSSRNRAVSPIPSVTNILITGFIALTAKLLDRWSVAGI